MIQLLTEAVILKISEKGREKYAIISLPSLGGGAHV
jgi:hypothetical protein